jgi:acetylornithine deacetylase/succinyl-diaminopimelate desuccinylase-like protein
MRASKINVRWVLLLCAIGCSGGWQAAAQSTAVEATRRYRQAHEADIVSDFAELLALPNVASDSAAIHRNAAYIVDAFRERGVEMETLKLPGAPPIIFGEWRVEGATRTLGIYVHYDGQPADPTNWTHEPWTPRLYDAPMEAGGRSIPMPAPGEPVDPEWRLYARSAGDDKAPIAALLAVLDVFREEQLAVTSNLKFFFEGEEEAGSVHLGDYLETYRTRLDDIDLWLFCDGPVHQSRQPQLVFGVRGVTGMELTVYGANRSLHSGHYGNFAPVPGTLLAHLLASMKDDETGEVTIGGFYDTVEPIGDEERKALANLPPFDDALRESLGLNQSEASNALLGERLLLPSLTVRGLASGNVGALARNVIPATATASLGIRLVKGNDPEHMQDLVEAHIRRQGYHIVREDPDPETRLHYPRIVKITRGSGYPAARTSMELPIAQQLFDAVQEAAGNSALRVPALGGSLPLYLFTGGLNKPAVIVPIANHDNNQHAPDENLRLANLWYGIDLYAAIFTMAEGM